VNTIYGYNVIHNAICLCPLPCVLKEPSREQIQTVQSIVKILTIYSDSKQCNPQWNQSQFTVTHSTVKYRALSVIVYIYIYIFFLKIKGHFTAVVHMLTDCYIYQLFCIDVCLHHYVCKENVYSHHANRCGNRVANCCPTKNEKLEQPTNLAHVFTYLLK
jgi:hypothetical protein